MHFSDTKPSQRPIRREELISLLRQHSRIFSDLQLELKKSTCEAVMVLRSKFLDQSPGLIQIYRTEKVGGHRCLAVSMAVPVSCPCPCLDPIKRRDRRTFSKKASEILNAFYSSNHDNRYPSHDEKEILAKQCGISVIQVSTWFGNKRIREKKKSK